VPQQQKSEAPVSKQSTEQASTPTRIIYLQKCIPGWLKLWYFITADASVKALVQCTTWKVEGLNPP